MTEKRFINDIDNGKLIDTKGELSTIHYSDAIDFYELWEFLNKLNDENEQLKQSYAQLKHRHSLLHDVCLDAECDRDMYHKDVLSLEKENEQLKQQLFETSKELLWATSDEVDRALYYEDEVEELRKEIFE